MRTWTAVAGKRNFGGRDGAWMLPAPFWVDRLPKAGWVGLFLYSALMREAREGPVRKLSGNARSWLTRNPSDLTYRSELLQGATLLGWPLIRPVCGIASLPGLLLRYPHRTLGRRSEETRAARERCDLSSIEISGISFVCVFAGALLGVFIRDRLPKHHLSGETKDVVRIGMGMVATIAALVLGLLISSAKTYYDAQREELIEMSANVLLLDRLLLHYGPEANGARQALRGSVGKILTKVWPEEEGEHSALLPTASRIEDLDDQIQGLTPKDEQQRVIQSQALSILLGMGKMRWLIFEQTSARVSMPLLVVMLFWLTSIFISWGMYSPSNATAVTTYFVAALSVSGAILLILELYTPYRGLLHLSSAPLRLAYQTLGQ